MQQKQFTQPIFLIGAASGMAAGNPGCEDGPLIIQQSTYWQDYLKQGLKITWQEMVFAKDFKHIQDSYQKIALFLEPIALATKHCIEHRQGFCVIGGDHACAIGTWSGASIGMGENKQLGLIWVDAHMDSHTPETTPSGNIHGMPVAALLGHGDKKLTHLLSISKKIKPENVCLIAIRSYEAGEQKLLEELGVKIVYMEEVHRRGLKTVWQEALDHIQKNADFFGVSIDLDGLDPIHAPGVGTPEINGVDTQTLLPLLMDVAKQSNFIGYEIAEFNPHEDKNHLTEHCAIDLIAAMA